MTMNSVTPTQQTPTPAPSGAARRSDGGELTCTVCSAAGRSVVAERALVASNVRAFASEQFHVWRCAGCGSIHARDEADLARYYAGYPFLELPLDWRLRAAYDEQLRRLEAAGLRHEEPVLDYGCGSGAFLRHLAASGYTRATGYDGYNRSFDDRARLERRYACVLAQDVLEHVAEPQALLDHFHDLVEPGGLIAIGTPNASAIDLRRADAYRHTLHAPYHRHIFSMGALVRSGERRGWSLVGQHATQYANTLVPFLNSSFYLFFMRTLDDTLDCLFEPPRIGPTLRRLPEALYWGLCGAYAAEATDIMVIFRRG